MSRQEGTAHKAAPQAWSLSPCSPGAQGVPRLPQVPPKPRVLLAREAAKDRGARWRTSAVTVAHPTPNSCVPAAPWGPSEPLVAQLNARGCHKLGSQEEAAEATLPSLKFISSVVKR